MLKYLLFVAFNAFYCCFFFYLPSIMRREQIQKIDILKILNNIFSSCFSSCCVFFVFANNKDTVVSLSSIINDKLID